MHWNLEQILWALALAGHLVLLVVLLGRDRASRYPFFTTAIILGALRLLADHLLAGKLTTLAFYWQNFSGFVLDSLVRILVLIEVTRRIFSSGKGGLILKPRGWAGWSILTSALALIAIYFWGPWPAWQALRAQPEQFSILLLVLTATKGQLLTSILTIEVAALILVFGKRFGFPWRTHPRQIALGLLVISICVLSAQGITEYLKASFNLRDRVQYDRATHILTQTDNAREIAGILVLLWWIIWLWREEPAPPSNNDDETFDLTPVLDGPPLNSLSAEATTEED
jgi:hypothetical protein